MLDIDYLGEPPAARRGTWSITAKYGSIFAVQDAVISETFVRFFWILDYPVWLPTERILSQRPRRCGRSSESSWLTR
eukprot:6074276-Pleurochrysis_carterae.AAC.1